MPTIGHVAVGLAGARVHSGDRPRWRSALVLTALASFPDLDVLFPGPATHWSEAWTHRGALHSLLAALAAAVLGSLLLGGPGGRRRAFLVSLAVAASHGLLDTLAPGGLGVMLLWPLSRARFLFPWPLLPPSPFSALPLFSPGFMALLLHEALVFAPLAVYALWPERRAARRAAGGDAS
jgi:membrane-bound metal-dependent hydrolase YbcI (DUF457 family)